MSAHENSGIIVKLTIYLVQEALAFAQEKKGGGEYNHAGHIF
jgi:hypothetical protein